MLEKLINKADLSGKIIIWHLHFIILRKIQILCVEKTLYKRLTNHV